MKRTLVERFCHKVAFAANGCWEWAGSRSDTGYGNMQVGSGKVRNAHRLSYEMFIGPVPDGLELDHLCRNRGCVNPAHLEPVTRTTNILRGNGPAIRKARTHCKNGHPFDAENTILAPHRICRACKNQRNAAYKRRSAQRQQPA